MTMTDGRFVGATEDEILTILMNNAKVELGDDLNDSQLSVIRTFYRPVAKLLADVQSDIGNVLDSAQLEYAEGTALDLLVALIGVSRKPAIDATGTEAFTRSSPADVNYTVPKGTVVQTDAVDPIRFKTNKKRIINGPATDDDTATYSTTSGTYATQTSITVDVSYRETLDVYADIRTTDATTPVAADLKIADSTNATTLHTDSTTSGSFVTSGPTAYDVSGLTGEITIEYRLRSGDGSTSVELTDSSTDKGGETGTDAPITAVEAGMNGNVGANTLTVMTDPPTGVESATNPAQTEGGENEETDDDLRERSKSELADGMRGTALGVRNQLLKEDGVKSVSLFINDSDSTDADGRPSQHTEYVVEGGSDQPVGQTLFESKAAGDGTIGGIVGTKVTVDAEIGNGQTHPVQFSRSTPVQIYVDMDLETTSEYGGDAKVRDAIVRYLGGLITSGDEEDGELRSGDDVIYTKVLSAVMSVDGVADAPSLTVGKSSSPTGTSNVAIGTTEVATGDATDGSIAITEL